MKHILIIGIGSGDPDHLTLQAIKAMNRANLFFLMDKGPAKGTLIDHRRQLCEKVISHSQYRFVEADAPERQRDSADYTGAVQALNQDKQAVYESLIDQHLADGECGAFLVWGDPALYDSTIRIIERIADSRPGTLDYTVIPGISSLQALAAQHRICLNSIGQAVQITPARRLAEHGFPPHLDSLLVMLDAQDTYTHLQGQGLTIYWGAYVGSADEVLIAGPLDEVAERIRRTRQALRERHGWIMDSYLLRKPQATL